MIKDVECFEIFGGEYRNCNLKNSSPFVNFFDAGRVKLTQTKVLGRCVKGNKLEIS